jgi:hypothetical protein
MSVAVPLEELRAELDRRSGIVYLLTVGDSGRPHCVAVRVGWDGDELEIRTGRSSARNAEARPGVTLLAPPQPQGAAEPPAGEDGNDTSGYSLIVDGDATGITTAPEGGGVVRVQPTHAVFHRPAEGPVERPEGACVHDCIPVYDRPPGDGHRA